MCFFCSLYAHHYLSKMILNAGKSNIEEIEAEFRNAANKFQRILLWCQ